MTKSYRVEGNVVYQILCFHIADPSALYTSSMCGNALVHAFKESEPFHILITASFAEHSRNKRLNRIINQHALSLHLRLNQ